MIPSRPTPPAFDQEILARLPTPSLVVDLAAAERNIARASGYFRGRSVQLRPHFKTHKCSRLIRRQLEQGSCAGVTCATPWEALILAKEGVADVVVANQVADIVGLDYLAAAATRARVTVCVDDPPHVAMLEAAAEAANVRVEILIEIDVGMARCGLPAGSDKLIPLAAAVSEAKQLRFRGLQGYEGHAVLRETRELRTSLVSEAAATLNAERARLADAGFDCEIITGGGTGTYDIATEAGALNEIQAGSYVLMDARYATLGLPFENALYCCTTVISRHGDGAVVNSGLKALTAEYGMSRPTTPELEILRLSDEHAKLAVAPGYEVSVGDTVLVIPAHIDPTINLYGSLFVFTTPDSVEEWPIDGRRPDCYFPETGALAPRC
jgi:D-serine deaminase-like pyridoxal phosphate-dependent protein